MREQGKRRQLEKDRRYQKEETWVMQEKLNMIQAQLAKLEAKVQADKQSMTEEIENLKHAMPTTYDPLPWLSSCRELMRHYLEINRASLPAPHM
jgi:predicted metal-dependent hydrolase